MKAFKDALKQAKIVHEGYCRPPPPTSPPARNASSTSSRDSRAKIIFIGWGSGNPYKIADLDLKRHGIEIATGGNILPAMATYKQFPGMGATYYYYGIPKNPVNDGWSKRHQASSSRRRTFTAGGFAAAMARGHRIKKTNADTATNTLINAMEGMSFETPKGTMTFRKEDHQAMQSMYHFKIQGRSRVAWAIPELVREIKADE